MPARTEHRDLSTVMGSWPFRASGKIGPISGDYGLVPTTLISKATITGIRREPSAGFDLDTETFNIWVDGVEKQVTFGNSGSNWTLAEVIDEINGDTVLTIAFNDNGFLRLESPTLGGASSLRLETVNTPDVFHELGLFAETVSYAGDVASPPHVDPTRQIAYPGQLSMVHGESFHASVFNRMAYQMAISTDRVYNLVAKKRLAIKKEVDHVYAGTEGDPKGVTLTGYMYTGPDSFTSPPTSAELDTIVQVLDANGNEIVKECIEILGSSSISADYWIDDVGKVHVVANSAGWDLAESDPNGDIYFKLTLVDHNATFDGIPLKLLERISNYEGIIQHTHPDTGALMEFPLVDHHYSALSEKNRITAERVKITGIYDSQGGSRVEKQTVAKYPLGSPDAVAKVELNNRIYVDGADFVTKSIAEGDLLTWSDALSTNPYSNSGNYRVHRVIDEETLELLGENFEPVYLNPVVGGGFGTIAITTDGAFWKDPFLRFDLDPAGSYVAPDAGSIKVIHLGMSSFLDAADSDPAFLAGPSVRYTQETAEAVQKAILNIWGSSAGNFNDVLYPTDNLANMSLERLDYRLNKEHSYATGKHQVILPEQVVVGLPDTGADQSRVIVHSDTTLPRYVHEVVAVEESAISSISTWRAGEQTPGSAQKFYRSETDTLGRKIETTDDQYLGQIEAWGVDSSSNLAAASVVHFKQDGAAGAAHVPGRIEWWNTDVSGDHLERMRLNNAGQLGLGIDPQYALHIAKTGLVVASIDRYSADAQSPVLLLSKSRGTSVGSLVETSNLDLCGVIYGYGVNSSNAAAAVGAITFQQVGAAGASYLPGKIVMEVGSNSVFKDIVLSLTHAGGVLCEAFGDGGSGVEGKGFGTGYGVQGKGGATADSIGVYGVSTATNGYGVKGLGRGTRSGVWGVGSGDSTSSAGVYGETSIDSGSGVRGVTGATNGYGVKGEGKGTGAGVYGVAITDGVGVKGLGKLTGAGVYGTGGVTNGSIGVYGTSSAAAGYGVKGVGTGSGYGVWGVAPGSGTGVLGSSASGYGISAEGNNTRAPLHLVPRSIEPTTGALGDLYIKGDNKLYICTVAGTPATWAIVGP